ncbi:hypothetical protein [uncultured Anaerovibrio sp.]|uniref:hypothetical protein n=1 Tax=uncultured Anaerovibrio sp. TaxID=361586 RepID=UPI0026250514|nr:hypothetical protein [uncultured Anaerovibrio sp.]
MNERIEKILKFWFPEYQIIDCIRKHGFIYNEKTLMHNQPTFSTGNYNGTAMPAPANDPNYNIPMPVLPPKYPKESNVVKTKNKAVSPINNKFADLKLSLRNKLDRLPKEYSSYVQGF